MIRGIGVQLMRGRRCLNPESMMCNNGIAACGQFRSWSLLGDEVGQWRELDKLNKQRRC